MTPRLLSALCALACLSSAPSAAAIEIDPGRIYASVRTGAGQSFFPLTSSIKVDDQASWAPHLLSAGLGFFTIEFKESARLSLLDVTAMMIGIDLPVGNERNVTWFNVALLRVGPYLEFPLFGDGGIGLGFTPIGFAALLRAGKIDGQGPPTGIALGVEVGVSIVWMSDVTGWEL